MLTEPELEEALILIHWHEWAETGIDISFEVWKKQLSKDDIQYIKENNDTRTGN